MGSTALEYATGFRVQLDFEAFALLVFREAWSWEEYKLHRQE